jgi:nudix-type nucleoside diphosphatase (YffH/AdpP family)
MTNHGGAAAEKAGRAGPRGKAGADPRVVARRTIYDGWNRMDLVTIEARGPDGAPRRHEREIVDHGEAAAVLIVEPKRDVAILVRQWRAPLVAAGCQPYVLEACSGVLDAGEGAEAGARREAIEETGYALRSLRRIGAVAPSIGTLTERIELFVGEAGERVANGGGNPKEGEDIETVEVPLAELFRMAAAGEIEDAKTLILVQRLMLERTGCA